MQVTASLVVHLSYIRYPAGMMVSASRAAAIALAASGRTLRYSTTAQQAHTTSSMVAGVKNRQANCNFPRVLLSACNGSQRNSAYQGQRSLAHQAASRPKPSVRLPMRAASRLLLRTAGSSTASRKKNAPAASARPSVCGISPAMPLWMLSATPLLWPNIKNIWPR